MTQTETPVVGYLPPNRRQILTILGGLMMGMFLAALDQTIVATAIRTIGDELNGLTLQAWVTTAYLITSTISTPLYGKLSDIYGRKPLYLTSIGLFLIGSLLSGTATSMYKLAGYRALQGLGGGGLMSLAITILGDLLSPRERARYQAMFLAVFGVSSVVGPIIGGFFANATTVLGITGWRWIFLVNVPFGIAGMVVITRVLHLPALHLEHRIDWQGAVTLAGGLIPLLVIAEQGRDWGWGSAAALACYGLGALGIGLFVWAEHSAGDEALLPLRLFRNTTFSSSAMINVVLGMGMFGGIATLPLWLQIVKGMDPTTAGLALLPFTGGIMVSSVIAGQTVGRTGRYKVFPIVGTGFLVVGAYLLSQMVPATAYGDVAWRSAVFGFGLGFCFQPLVLAVQNAVPPRDMGTATSSSLFFRQMGGTLGTAVFLSILFSTVGGKIGSAFQAAAKTPEFQAALADKAVHEQPRERARAPSAGRPFEREHLAERLLVHRAPRPAARGADPGRLLQQRLAGDAHRCVRAGGRLRAVVVPAGAAAAHGLRHPEPDGRGRRGRRRRGRRRSRDRRSRTRRRAGARHHRRPGPGNLAPYRHGSGVTAAPPPPSHRAVSPRGRAPARGHARGRAGAPDRGPARLPSRRR